MPNPCWRHHNRNPLSTVDRIRQEGDNFVKVMKDGTVEPVAIDKRLVQEQIKNGTLVSCEDEPLVQLQDDELSFSMISFMEHHGGERILKAVADACKEFAQEANSDLDGTSAQVWTEAERLVRQAANHLAAN